MRISLYLWFKSLEVTSQLSLCSDEVNRCHETIGIDDLTHIRAHFLSEVSEYSDHFSPFLALQLTYSVIRLNDFRWFNIHRFTRRTLIMNNARDLSLQSRSYWYHQTTITYCRCNIPFHESFSLCRTQDTV